MSERAKRKINRALEHLHYVKAKMDDELVPLSELEELLWKQVEHIVQWCGNVVIEPCESFYSEGNLFNLSNNFEGFCAE